MLFSDKEKEEGRKNGFILGGKTGTGKSTLINAMMGEEVAEARKDSFSVTTKTAVYYYRLKSGKMITILDTPGLMDTNTSKDPNIDNIHLREIQEKVYKENIQVKGIIFLVNFQNERFDASEQEALINYNKIFPLPNFWEHILVVFTHYFGDPDGDDEEEMKKTRDESNKKILGTIMERIKNISTVIDYNDLTTKYFNSYSPVKTPKQKSKNDKNKEELEVYLENISKKEPLFTRVEMVTKENYVVEENKVYYKGTLVIVGFIGLAGKPIKQEENVYNKIQITKEEYEKLKDDDSDITFNQFQAERDDSGNLTATATADNKGYYYELFKNGGIGAFIGAALGTVGAVGVGLLCLNPVGIGVGVVAAAAGGGGVLGSIAGFIKGIISRK